MPGDGQETQTGSDTSPQPDRHPSCRVPPSARLRQVLASSGGGVQAASLCVCVSVQRRSGGGGGGGECLSEREFGDYVLIWRGSAAQRSFCPVMEQDKRRKEAAEGLKTKL